MQVKTEKVQQAIPFERTLIRDESYPEGRMRVVQLGENGTIQIVYTITIENGQQVSRRETGRQIVLQPKDEILAIGTQGSLPSIPVAGMVTYLANENAWVMRNDSSDKRPLTTTGDLDGRVFSLSADGRYLLYSRAGAENSTVLNSVWLVDTLVNDPPRQLPLQDVLYAELSGDARTVRRPRRPGGRQTMISGRRLSCSPIPAPARVPPSCWKRNGCGMPVSPRRIVGGGRTWSSPRMAGP
ncbi:MAG: G5 domain-containing protein [Chloroflexi bacterium]|nr:G5 domain-containing protein [Chloroflexota bacterium]